MVFVIFLRSRFTSGRSFITPLGNDFDFVAKGNKLAAQCMLLALLASAMGIKVVVEQPAGSCLDYLPRFQWFLKVVQVLFLNLICLLVVVVASCIKV